MNNIKLDNIIFQSGRSPQIKNRHNNITEYTIDNINDALEFKAMFNIRGACLSETMGPNWKDIVWFVNGNIRHPYVTINKQQ